MSSKCNLIERICTVIAMVKHGEILLSLSVNCIEQKAAVYPVLLHKSDCWDENILLHYSPHRYFIWRNQNDLNGLGDISAIADR